MTNRELLETIVIKLESIDPVSYTHLHIGAGPKVFHPPMSKLIWA